MTWRQPPHTRAGRVCHRVSWRPSEKSAAPPPQGDVHCVSFPGVADGVCGCSERPSPGALFPAGHCWGARGSPPPISPHALTNSSQLVVLLFPLNSFRKNITCFPRERPSRFLWEHRAPGRKHREVTSLWTAITLGNRQKNLRKPTKEACAHGGEQAHLRGNVGARVRTTRRPRAGSGGRCGTCRRAGAYLPVVVSALPSSVQLFSCPGPRVTVEVVSAFAIVTSLALEASSPQWGQ